METLPGSDPLLQWPPTILWGALPSNSYFRLYLNPTILRGKEGTLAYNFLG